MKQSTLRLAACAGLIALSPLAASQSFTVTPAETALSNHITNLVQRAESGQLTTNDIQQTSTLVQAWAQAAPGEGTDVTTKIPTTFSPLIADLASRKEADKLEPVDVRRLHETFVNVATRRLTRRMATLGQNAGSIDTGYFTKISEYLTAREATATAIGESTAAVRRTRQLIQMVEGMRTAAASGALPISEIETFENVLTSSNVHTGLQETEALTMAGRANVADFTELRRLVNVRVAAAKLEGDAQTTARRYEAEIIKALDSLQAQVTPSKRPTASTPTQFANVTKLVTDLDNHVDANRVEVSATEAGSRGTGTPVGR